MGVRFSTGVLRRVDRTSSSPRAVRETCLASRAAGRLGAASWFYSSWRISRARRMSLGGSPARLATSMP